MITLWRDSIAQEFVAWRHFRRCLVDHSPISCWSYQHTAATSSAGSVPSLWCLRSISHDHLSSFHCDVQPFWMRNGDNMSQNVCSCLVSTVTSYCTLASCSWRYCQIPLAKIWGGGGEGGNSLGYWGAMQAITSFLQDHYLQLYTMRTMRKAEGSRKIERGPMMQKKRARTVRNADENER